MSIPKTTGGFIKVYRAWLDHPFLQKKKHYQDMLQFILSSACWKEEGQDVQLHYSVIHLDKDQAAISARQMAEKFNVSHPSVTSFLNRLCDLGFIQLKKLPHGCIVTINKYDPKNENLPVNLPVKKAKVTGKKLPVESEKNPDESVGLELERKSDKNKKVTGKKSEKLPVKLPVLYNTALRTREEPSVDQLEGNVNSSLERKNKLTEDSARADSGSLFPALAESKAPAAPAPAPVPKQYAWEGRVIRLNPRDYDRWLELYPNLRRDFDAILYNVDLLLADEIADGKMKPDRWFGAAARILLAKHQKTPPPPPEEKKFDHANFKYPPCGKPFDPPLGWKIPGIGTPGWEGWAAWNGWPTTFANVHEHERKRKEKERESQAKMGKPVQH